MDNLLNFAAPSLFGLEGIIASQLRRIGAENIAADNGIVRFSGDENTLAAANIWLACGERVLLTLGTFKADTFDMLFEGVRALPLERFIDKSGAFPVTGYSRGSKLRSVPDCQKIIKKAAATRLGSYYGYETMPETGETYQIRFSIADDICALYLDTSGEGLHKRGYRPKSVAAPLRETIAAGMIEIAKFRGKQPLRDPFCGSGTIAIEAALSAKNRAPGLFRRFAAEKWPFIAPSVWTQARENAKSREYRGAYDILGTDIDPECVEIARENSKRAGVDDIVRFETADARTPRDWIADPCVIVTNPPYGERVMEKSDAALLYRQFGQAVKQYPDAKLYILSSHTEFEREFGRPASKKRKLYNGMIKCDLFIM